MSYQKIKRIIDEELLDVVRSLPCVACNKPPPNHAHHLFSKGSGGDDVASNIISLCFSDHREIHDHGLTAMADKYPSVRYWLELAGWEYCETRKKWTLKINKEARK